MLRVEVEWMDSGLARDNGWESRRTLDSKVRFKKVSTIGYLLLEDSERVVLVQTEDDINDTYFGAMAIWRPSITRMTVLRARKDFDGSHYFLTEEQSREEGTPDNPFSPDDLRGLGVSDVSGGNLHREDL